MTQGVFCVPSRPLVAVSMVEESKVDQNRELNEEILGFDRLTAKLIESFVEKIKKL